MLTTPNATIPQQKRKDWHIPVFRPATKLVWAILISVTVITEVMPIPPMPRLPFYLYYAAKLVCFIAVGFLAPLAFWRFNALNRGILLAGISATFVESLQGTLRYGHSFHWYELLGKLILILIGFALALDARYERRISIGPFHLLLLVEHPSE